MSLLSPYIFGSQKKIKFVGLVKESLIIFPSAILNTKIWRNYVEYEFVFFFGCSRTQSLELCEIGRRTKGSEENRREVVFRFL